MNADTADKLADLTARSEQERRRFHARKPKPVASVMAGLLAQRGYAASKASDGLAAVWGDAMRQVIGESPLTPQTQASGLSRGTFEVMVANHVVMQELNFFRPGLLRAVQQAMPTARVNALRFKVGRIHN